MSNLVNKGLGTCLKVKQDFPTQAYALNVSPDTLDLHLDALALGKADQVLLQLSILLRAFPVRWFRERLAVGLADIEDVNYFESDQLILFFTFFVNNLVENRCQDWNAMLAFPYTTTKR